MFVKENCVCIGKIVRTHGIHGQLVVVSDFQITEQEAKEAILVDIDGGLVPFFVKKNGWKTRDHQSYFVHFDHILDKETADAYCGLNLYLEKLDKTDGEQKTNNSAETEETLIGYTVCNELEKTLGIVDEIFDFSGNVLFKILSDENDELLIPFTEEYLLKIDEVERIIKLQIPEGLLDL